MDPMDEPELKIRCTLPTRTVLLVLTETVLIIPVLMMLWWVFGYMDGVSLDSDNSNEFNWHPIAMIIGMFFLFGNAVIAYRLFPFGRKINKWIHAVLHLLAVGFIAFGLYAVIKYHNDFGYTNFYSLHSWIGIVTSVSYIIWALFSTGVFQDFDSRRWLWLRRWYLPLHIAGGMFLLFGAFFAIETGIVEKALFRTFSGYLLYDEYTTEAWVVNVMCFAVLVALLFLIYVLYTIPRILVASSKTADPLTSDRAHIIAQEAARVEMAVGPYSGTDERGTAFESAAEAPASSPAGVVN